MALRDKQKCFVDEYLIDLNATQAAIRAGYSARTANEQASRLLANVKIQAAVQEAMKARGERTTVTADRVVLEAAWLATFDPRKLFRADGYPIPIHELDDDTAAAIAGVEVRIEPGEDGGTVLKYKVADKNSALDKLFRHHGLYEKDNKQVGDGIASAIERARARMNAAKRP